MEVIKGQNILSFVKELPNDDACKAYLSKVKWQDGFRCMKYGHTKGCEKSGYKYHCYGCNHVESATANTLFHKVKFGLQKAFCVVFEMSTSSKMFQVFKWENVLILDKVLLGILCKKLESQWKAVKNIL
tara:strand:+ start:145 stop:531 length:387 start_codon:yes stop_codon:yes gene_type:complete